MLSTIEGCRKRLQKWVEVLEHSHPSYQHDIPDPISMSICKLGSGNDSMSDTFNGLRNTRRLIVEKVHESAEALRKDDSDYICALEAYLWNHFRNMWIGGMTKALYNLL